MDKWKQFAIRYRGWEVKKKPADFLKPILARRAPRRASLLCRFSAIEGSACNKSEPQVAASRQNSGFESLHAKRLRCVFVSLFP